MDSYKVLSKTVPYKDEFGNAMFLRAVVTEYVMTKTLAINLDCLMDGEEYWEPYTDVTIALPESPYFEKQFGKETAFLHINHFGPTLLKKLEELGAKRLKPTVRSGYVDFPLYDFSEFIRNMDQEEMEVAS